MGSLAQKDGPISVDQQHLPHKRVFQPLVEQSRAPTQNMIELTSRGMPNYVYR
jgi:hypothetical protein